MDVRGSSWTPADSPRDPSARHPSRAREPALGLSTRRRRTKGSWHGGFAVDFFTVETIWLQRLYVLFFIELGSRRVHVAGCTPNPSAPWVTQQARQLTWTLAERPESFRFLIRDRDQKFTDSFDEVFRSNGLEIIRTPFRAPQANGVAERFVRSVRSECLDWLLILNDQPLERVLDVFEEHYNGHRPHRALALTPPRRTRPPVAPTTEWGEPGVQRRDRLGCVVHVYVQAA